MRPRVLYVVYWGALEPLGRSLVVPPVLKLARMGVDFTLVTFEKREDWLQADALREVRQLLAAGAVRWIPLRYHKRPKVPATAFDILNGIARGVLARARAEVDLVHARTFVGGPIGLVLASLLRRPWIYHNEGFYPDEQVDGGVWREGSAPHRIARRLERALYDRADAVVALSHRARRIIEELPSVREARKPVIVVPSCVDTTLFATGARPPRAEELRLIYIGSVGARYILDAVGRFVEVARRRAPGVRLRVLTPAAPTLVEGMLDASGLPRHVWTRDRVPRERMPEELGGQHAGLFFLTQGLSEHGCSPTKIGEYWAAGLPVVTTANVSDTDEIIRRERVGVVIEEHTEAGYARAVDALLTLLEDPELRARCRSAAEAHYGLEAACRRQYQLYARLIGGPAAHAAGVPSAPS